MPDGFTFSAVVVNVPFYVQLAEAVQAQLAEIGVTMDVQVLEPAQLLPSFVVEQTADAYFSNWPGAVGPVQDDRLADAGAELPQPGRGDAAAARRRRVRRARRRPTGRTGPGFYQDIARLQVEEALHLPVCSPNGIVARTEQVQGLQMDRAGMWDFLGADMN